MGENTTNQGASWTGQGGKFHWYDIYGISLCSEIELSFPDSESIKSADVSLLLASRDFFREATQSAVVNPSPTGWYKYARLDKDKSYHPADGLFEFLLY